LKNLPLLDYVAERKVQAKTKIQIHSEEHESVEENNETRVLGYDTLWKIPFLPLKSMLHMLRCDIGKWAGSCLVDTIAKKESGSMVLIGFSQKLRLSQNSGVFNLGGK